MVSGCASSLTKDIQIEAEADPKTDFSGYHTYTWLGSATIVNDPLGQWEPASFDADTEIKFLLDRELRKRGMTESRSNSDFIVTFAAGVDMTNLDLKEDPESKKSVLVNVPKGGLLVAFVDSESGFVIWSGVATADVLKRAEIDIAKKRLDFAVRKLIGQVPK